MGLVKNEKVINIMQRTLNYVDSRLINHGTRVAYLIFKTLKPQNKYDDRQLRDICILAMLHDIGAYKTEEIDKMVLFETINVWEHSIYGYLFLKYFSPLKELSPAILFHHADCGDLNYISPSHRELAQIISLCDRADVFSQTSNDLNGFYKYIEKHRDKKFFSEIINMFLSANIDFGKIDEGINSDKDFIGTFYETPMSAKEADEYIKMTIFSIEFRSSFTVIHTIATACISRILAELSGFNESDIEKVVIGAMLHDIGKIGIPISILESPNKLDAKEMEIMRTHVEITEKILSENVGEDVKTIAVNHHERLDGSGYLKKISAPDISTFDRILIVADIFSALYGVRSYKGVFSKEKIVDTLNDMSTQGYIDSNIVSLAMNNFEYIVKELENESKPIIETYNKLHDEYSKILENVGKSKFEDIDVS